MVEGGYERNSPDTFPRIRARAYTDQLGPADGASGRTGCGLRFWFESSKLMEYARIHTNQS